MPWCPQCRQEYEGHVARCFDCDADLVEELVPGGPAVEAPRAPGGDGGPAASPAPAGGPGGEGEPEGDDEGGEEWIQVADPEAMAYVRQILTALGAAYDEEPGPEGGTSLRIRGGAARAVLRAMDEEAFPVVREETSEGPRFRKHDPSRDPEILDPPILRQGIGELRRGGREAVDQLVAIARTASRARREESLYLLGKLGEAGEEALVTLAVEHAGEGDEGRLLAVLRTLQEAGIFRRRVEPLEPYLSHRDPRVRRLAAVAAGRMGAVACAPGLIALYEDCDPLVREEADDALTRLSGEDLGYEADHDTEQARGCVERRRQWWESIRETRC